MKPWMAGGWAVGGALLGGLLVWTLVPSKGGGEEPKEAAEHAEQEEKTEGLTLDAKAQSAAGIRTAPVEGARASAATADGYAKAIDLSPLAALAADAESARAALAASEKQVARLAALTREDQSAAPKDLEAAQAQLAADRARLTLACRKIGLDFGAGLSRMGCGNAAGLVREAAEGRAAVVRIDVQQGVPPSSGTIVIGDGLAAATILGPAASADPQLQTAGVLALVRGSAAARLGVGRTLPVHFAGAGARAGILVPRAALMRADGGQFVYRALSGGRFARVGLENGEPMAGGWFFTDGALKPGDAIVVAGATTLLGLERGPQEAEE